MSAASLPVAPAATSARSACSGVRDPSAADAESVGRVSEGVLVERAGDEHQRCDGEHGARAATDERIEPDSHRSSDRADGTADEREPRHRRGEVKGLVAEGDFRQR